MECKNVGLVQIAQKCTNRDRPIECGGRCRDLPARSNTYRGVRQAVYNISASLRTLPGRCEVVLTCHPQLGRRSARSSHTLRFPIDCERKFPTINTDSVLTGADSDWIFEILGDMAAMESLFLRGLGDIQ